ncbi:predicted protein [Postia placenta Mad-698-R]|uniref:Uncharacterized protein n=1 Tax=Postia placenta MAD-698-R-SB12 TaxID=670580 RepID=A0A1X6NCH3_9APHY|nr:hypothetical protein POSPLADRAFT_1131823 [Postia placenta MAD-698-R-SB12]EED77507.1 predicted protein [Postia placenta Mad-698-R]EED83242.1 predicted protein [Postia placenta Mad-698-R]OSX66192.1 hypothetical protein POSPLADRAFT_1131823 [Postia placenta MAD-698-R-SB12]
MCPAASSTSSWEEIVQLRPTGLADVEDLLDLGGTLVSVFPHGEGFKLNFAVDAGGNAAQVPIPGAVCQTLEQHGKLRSSAFFTNRLVCTEFGQLYLSHCFIIEVAKAGFGSHDKSCLICKGGHYSLNPELH